MGCSPLLQTSALTAHLSGCAEGRGSLTEGAGTVPPGTFHGLQPRTLHPRRSSPLITSRPAVQSPPTLHGPAGLAPEWLQGLLPLFLCNTVSFWLLPRVSDLSEKCLSSYFSIEKPLIIPCRCQEVSLVWHSRPFFHKPLPRALSSRLPLRGPTARFSLSRLLGGFPSLRAVCFGGRDSVILELPPLVCLEGSHSASKDRFQCSWL